MIVYIILFICICVINYANSEVSGDVFASKRVVMVASLIRLYFAMLVSSLSWNNLDFTLNIAYASVIFSPYLCRESRLSAFCPRPSPRHVCDKLILSSAMYFIAFVLAMYNGIYYIGTLCFATALGSTMYHRNREIKFFNLDNIFATSLLAFYCWSLTSAYYYNEVVFLIGTLGMPVAGFLLVYCGMPAEVIFTSPSHDCCIRKSRPLYDNIHTLWHLFSGLGPIVVMWYLGTIKCYSAVDCSASDPFSQSKELLVALVALAVGLSINISGNLAGIMPLD